MGETLIRVTDVTYEDDDDLIVKVVGRASDGRRVVKNIYKDARKVLLQSVQMATQMPAKIEAPDREVLKKKYKEQRDSLTEIADEFGVSATTVHRWMKEYDIDRRDSWAERGSIRCYAGPYTGGTRYTMLEHYENGEYDTRFYEHQLVAIAHGANPHKVFATDEFCTHHINGHEFDNRPSNLELMTKRAHQALDSIFSLTEGERDEVLQIAEERHYE